MQYAFNEAAKEGNRPPSIFLIFFLAFVFFCGSIGLAVYQSGSETTKQNTNQEQLTKWYGNGNLHQSTIKEWKQSTEENRLATSSDWVLIASKTIKAKVKDSGNIDTVKPYAQELVKCINKATQGITTVDHQQSADIAITCMTLMGWL